MERNYFSLYIYNLFILLYKRVNIDIVGGVKEVPPPEDLEDRSNHYIMKMDFKAIKAYLPSIELLACTKIFTDRQKDLDDLENTNILEQCDL